MAAPTPSNIALLMPFAGINGDGLTQDYSATPISASKFGVPRLSGAQKRGKYENCGEFSTNNFVITDSIPALDFSGQWVAEVFIFLPHAVLSGGSSYRPLFSAMDKNSNTDRLQFFLGDSIIPDYPDIVCWSDSIGHLLVNAAKFTEEYCDKWTHIAFQRDQNGYVTLFLDGAYIATGTNTAAPSFRDFITFNVNRSGNEIISTPVMYLSDARITCGEAFYPNAGFIPGKDGFLGDMIQTQGQASKVSGIVQIDGTPAQRTVRAFGYDPTTHALDGSTVNLSKSLGHATSDPETGDYTIDLLAGYGQEIFVVAFDDYGAPFTPEANLAAGARIHPTTPNGHVWETTGAGALPVDEPTWVVDTETSQLYGTASMIARPFYRPMVHGPIMPEVTTPDPAP